MNKGHIVTDWSLGNDLKYRRIGDTMEVIIFDIFVEEPKVKHLTCNIPCGLKGHEIAHPETLKTFHEESIFLGEIMPKHWTIQTRRQFKIDGWNKKVIVSEDVKILELPE